MNNKLIEREIFGQITAHLKEQEVTVITGARQTGKTTLLFQLKDWLFAQKKVKQSQLKFFNLDLISDLTGIRNQDDFIKFLKEELGREEFLYVFIDEIQRLENSGKFLKGIYDVRLPVKFVVSGSSSLEIKSKISESLAGRKRLFHLWPFSFSEYLSCYEPSLRGLLKKDGISTLNRRKIMDYFFDFVVFGGYPRVVLSKDKKEKIAVLNEIYSSYVEKDIVGFMKVKNPFAFSKLVALLGDQIGNLVNLHELTATLGLNFRTIENYLFALESTFVVNLARPYFTNARKELTKMPKVYFVDTGMRNLSVKYFANFSDSRDRGKLLENFVSSSIVKLWDGVVNYWRTKDRNEVDFILRNYYGEIVPVEVKAIELGKPEINSGLKAFIEKYKPKKAFIVNLALEEKIKIRDTEIYFILPYNVPISLAKQQAR
ncbi:MAG: ATP-binding protein [Candidatus Omnitrophica bacterium]|nr:ATP-binding protein [Candidatus Omnitrophota bacterium]